MNHNSKKIKILYQFATAKKKTNNGNVEIIWNHTVEEIIGDDDGVTGIHLASTDNSSQKKKIDVNGAFIAIGHTPNTNMFNDQLQMNNGYIVINAGLDGNSTSSSVPGVFAAGDVSDQIYRQAITSAGAGCMAALDAEKYLDHLKESN